MGVGSLLRVLLQGFNFRKTVWRAVMEKKNHIGDGGGGGGGQGIAPGFSGLQGEEEADEQSTIGLVSCKREWGKKGK